ncbi:ribosomal-protein-alanine N-acetyltransferase [Alcanivorax hongdengensis A-11-3]|uniref:[Ribosomal protein bS18]-alanine N-acetyltransferase n=1 Tax=Alcanivorax hongdengensis A-11-3 TaxID=1177179 RepID=L0WB74_9GAMM|nr:ribosomal protein S18-alanine N-acetyltransferase [Alcanivorax hongdengensis]EKF74221.1 ribosomal-protein-alanine N-acetyltransferase [Alcanivorax hongdengensis A-11-3]
MLASDMEAAVPGLQCREMEPEDLEAVTAIEQAAQVTPWGMAHFRDCLQTDYYRCEVAVQGEQPLAFLILSQILDEMHVLNIAVAPAFQRRGVARHLLMAALERARREAMSVIYLEVRESNHGARQLYHSLGFEVTGLRKNYYRRADEGRENAVLMQCVLAPHP